MDAKTYPLQDILKPERRYIIPTFQRDYGGDPGTVAAPYNATSEPGMAEHLIGIARAKLFA